MDFRCAGDMQVRHEGGLHPGIAKLPLQVCTWILHGHIFQRNIGSSHRQGRCNHTSDQRKRHRNREPQTESSQGEQEELKKRDMGC